VAVYHDSYARWRQLYPRLLELSEDGLLNPLWRAAGSGARPRVGKAGTAQ